MHVKLYYPKLDKKSALEIWKMNMRRIADSGLDITIKENEIKKFAKKLWADSEDKQTQRWNGRQIRNAFQSAIALARWDYQEDGINDEGRPVLSVQQFEVVSRTSSEFDNYISTMHGIDEANDTWETIAARELLRKNDTPRKPISRSTPVARARGSRKKVETSDEDSDEDSDENEEEMTKLKAKLDKLEKRKGPSSDKAREDNVTKKSLKVAPQPEKKDEELSSASDESD